MSGPRKEGWFGALEGGGCASTGLFCRKGWSFSHQSVRIVAVFACCVSFFRTSTDAVLWFCGLFPPADWVSPHPPSSKIGMFCLLFSHWAGGENQFLPKSNVLAYWMLFLSHLLVPKIIPLPCPIFIKTKQHTLHFLSAKI